MYKQKYIGIILAAGNGKRLGIKYKNTSKVLIPINKKKVSLDYNIRILLKANIKKIIINSYRHYYKIKRHIEGKYTREQNIKIVKEKKLYGTAQSVFRITKNIKKFDTAIILYGDNISKINLRRLLQFHEKNKFKFSIVANHSKDSRNSGVINVIGTNTLGSFEEKKIKKKIPNWVNAGIYIISKNIIKTIGVKKDFSHNLIPFLLKKKIIINIYKTKSKVYTIDNKKLLFKTRKEINY